MDSVFPKGIEKYRKVKTLVHNIVANTRQMRITLDKLHFLTENRMTFFVSQLFGTAPTGWNARNVIESMQVVLSGGNLFDFDGQETVNMCRLLGGASLEQSVLGVNASAQFSLDLHYLQTHALHDLNTALHTDKLKTFDLLITFSPTLGFVGGTAPVAPALPNQQVAFDLDAIYLEGYDKDYSVGTMLPKKTAVRRAGFGAGQETMELELGGLNRMIMFSVHTLNADASLTPNDAILQKLTIKVGDQVVREYDAFELKSDTHEKFNGFNQAGVYVVSFGDDEAGWLNLSGQTKATVVFDPSVAAPAKWICRVLQDQSVAIPSLNG